LAKWEKVTADLTSISWADGGAGAQSWDGALFADGRN
jgi:hypothetical protein